MLKIFWIAVLAVIFCICPSAGECRPNPLPAELRAGLHVEDVRLIWQAPEGPAKDTQRFTYDKHKDGLAARLGPAVRAAYKDSPSGAKAVVIEIVVTGYVDNGRSIMLVADANFIDPADGTTIGSYKRIVAFHTMNRDGLIGAMVDRAMKWDDYIGVMVTQYAATLRKRFDHK